MKKKTIRRRRTKKMQKQRARLLFTTPMVVATTTTSSSSSASSEMIMDHSSAPLLPLQPLPIQDESVQELVTDLQCILGYTFNDHCLLVQALTHPSHPSRPTYQRLEHVGDAALNLAFTNYLYRKHPGLEPGPLSVLRSANVSTEKLARVNVRHGFYNYLRRISDVQDQMVEEFTQSVLKEDAALAAGAAFGGTSVKAPKILADIVEALAAAVYIDAGYNVGALWKVFKRLLQPIITSQTLDEQPVTKVYELCQKLGKNIEFVDSIVKGQGDNTMHVVKALVDGVMIVERSSEHKTIAKLNAARDALSKMSDELRKKILMHEANKNNPLQEAPVISGYCERSDVCKITSTSREVISDHKMINELPRSEIDHNINSEVARTEVVRNMVTEVPRVEVVSKISDQKMVYEVPRSEIDHNMNSEVARTEVVRNMVTEVPRVEVVSQISDQEMVNEVPIVEVVSQILDQEMVNEVPRSEIDDNINMVTEVPIVEVVSQISDQEMVNEVPRSKIDHNMNSEVRRVEVVSQISMVNEVPRSEIDHNMDSEVARTEVVRNMVTKVPRVEVVFEISDQKMVNEVPRSEIDHNMNSEVARTGVVRNVVTEVPRVEVVSQISDQMMVSEVPKSEIVSQISDQKMMTEVGRTVTQPTTKQVIFDVCPTGEARVGAKQELHQLCGKNHWGFPVYNLEKAEGPPHDKKFAASVLVQTPNANYIMVSGMKQKLKEAENHAAFGLLVKLHNI